MNFLNLSVQRIHLYWVIEVSSCASVQCVAIACADEQGRAWRFTALPYMLGLFASRTPSMCHGETLQRHARLKNQLRIFSAWLRSRIHERIVARTLRVFGVHTLSARECDVEYPQASCTIGRSHQIFLPCTCRNSRRSTSTFLKGFHLWILVMNS